LSAGPPFLVEKTYLSCFEKEFAVNTFQGLAWAMILSDPPPDQKRSNFGVGDD